MNKFIDDDDLSSLPVSKNNVHTTTSETKASAVAAGATAANTAVAVVRDDDDGEVDLIGDHDALKAKASLSNVLPKEQGKVSRYAFVRNFKSFAKGTHFLEGAGPNRKGLGVVCPGEGCVECSRGGDHSPRRKVVALCVKYTNVDSAGKFPQGTTKPEIAIGFIALSPTAYTELSECPSEGETIYDCDYKSAKKSNNIGWSYNRMSSPPAYVKAGMEDEVAALANEIDPKILRGRLGKFVTAAELKALTAAPFVDTAAALADLEGID